MEHMPPTVQRPASTLLVTAELQLLWWRTKYNSTSFWRFDLTLMMNQFFSCLMLVFFRSVASYLNYKLLCSIGGNQGNRTEMFTLYVVHMYCNKFATDIQYYISLPNLKLCPRGLYIVHMAIYVYVESLVTICC